jgi:hypothetical protein
VGRGVKSSKKLKLETVLIISVHKSNNLTKNIYVPAGRTSKAQFYSEVTSNCCKNVTGRIRFP